MESQRIEYLRKNGRKQGRKKGVMWCGVDPDDENKVMVGFSICSALDKFDWVSDRYEPGFGLELAQVRADKWKDKDEYFVQLSYPEPELYSDDVSIMKYVNPNTKEILEIPPSIVKRLKTFIVRCKKYYKDKDFPVWVEKLNNGENYSYELLEKKQYIEYIEM